MRERRAYIRRLVTSEAFAAEVEHDAQRQREEREQRERLRAERIARQRAAAAAEQAHREAQEREQRELSALLQRWLDTRTEAELEAVCAEILRHADLFTRRRLEDRRSNLSADPWWRSALISHLEATWRQSR